MTRRAYQLGGNRPSERILESTSSHTGENSSNRDRLASTRVALAEMVVATGSRTIEPSSAKPKSRRRARTRLAAPWIRSKWIASPSGFWTEPGSTVRLRIPSSAASTGRSLTVMSGGLTSRA